MRKAGLLLALSALALAVPGRAQDMGGKTAAAVPRQPTVPTAAVSPSAAADWSRLAGEADRAEQRHDVKAALTLAERILAASEGAFGPDDLRIAASLVRVGRAYLAQGRQADAEAPLRRALAIVDRTGARDRIEAAAPLASLGESLWGQGRAKDSEPFFKEALDVARRLGGEGHEETGRVAVSYGFALATAGRFAEADAIVSRAMAALGAPRERRAIELRATHAALRALQGRYVEAEALYRSVLADSEQALGKDDRATLAIAGNLATCLFFQARASEAEPLYRRVVEEGERAFGAGHPEVIANLSDLAKLLAFRGEVAEGERLQLRAVETSEAAFGPDHPYALNALEALAALYVRQDRFAEAEPIHFRAFQARMRKQGFDHPDTIASAKALSDIYAGSGQGVLAELLYRRVLNLREEGFGRTHPSTIAARIALASFYASGRRYDDSEPLYREALTDLDSIESKDLSAEIVVRQGLAAVDQSHRRFAEADAGFARALEASERLFGRDHPTTADIAATAAQARLQSPSPAAALAPARLVAEAYRHRRDAQAPGLVAEAQAQRVVAQGAARLTLLADAGWAAAPAGGDGRDAAMNEAFAALQDAAAGTTERAVVRMAARRLADAQGGKLGALVREREGLGERWAEQSAAYSAAFAATGPEADSLRARLSFERTAVEARMAVIDARLRKDFPQYFDLVRPQALDLKVARKMLGRDEAVLIVVPTEFGTQIMALTREGLEWRRSDWTRTKVDEAVRRLLWDVGATVEVSAVQAAEWEIQAGPGFPYDRSTAFALHQAIVAPVAESLRGKSHVFIAAAGSLSSLPFGMLVAREPVGSDADPEALRATAWLADAFALVQIPSVQSLQFLRRHAKEKSVAADSFLGFGDPALRGTAEARGRGRGGAGKRSGAPIADTRALGEMNRLPGTAVELENLRVALGAPPRSLFLAERATESAVRSTDLSNTRILALATHGLMAGETGLAQPGLVFTPPATPSAEDDGLLTAAEVSALRLDADWVILSACNTAAGDGSAGAPGLSGLARAFFYAGARNLLASHWPVGDDVAARLVVRTLQIVKEAPSLSRAQAFQRAVREIRDDRFHDGGDGSWAHPAAWAPFSLIGDSAR